LYILWKKIIVNSKAKRHITNGNCSGGDKRRLRVPQNPSRAAPFMVFCSTTFFVARKMLRIFLIGQQKTSVT
jgi:hypothetical protein